MDDRHAHFVTMLGDACTSAGLADISVELLLRDGRRVSGTPSHVVADPEHSAIGDTGYASRLFMDGREARLEDVVELILRAP